MKELLITMAALLTLTATAQTIVNGIPWYDQNGNPVSAHGANIIKDGGKYYLFGEYKTDSANVFTGFSCYSSDNLSQWHFEGIAFSQQKDGRMGPNRVGERPKVLKCPKTGEYVMLMHTDNMQYKDPYTCYATSKTITGPYKFQGPILYKGQPVKKWDIGSFMDDDGRGYLLVHHGVIYRLAEDFHSLDSCLMNGVKGSGESPAMMKKDGIYYWMSSHTTSWERNDNIYWTSTSLGGPWTFRGEFCPVGSLTWNSQCSFLLPLDNGRWMYMGDRWSFPRQQQAATYVWLPIEAKDSVLSISHYIESWDLATGKPVSLPLKTIAQGRTLTQPGETFTTQFDTSRIGLKGTTDENSCYAEITIFDEKDQVVFETSVDFYSKTPVSGLRWLSPVLPKGKYTLQVRCSEMKPNWTDKKRTLFGSKGYKVEISEVITSSNQRDRLYQSFITPPDSIRVGCYYYWVNEHVDPKGVKADLQWMKDNGITLAFLATDIRNRTRWEKPWEGETFGKNKFQSKLWWKNLRTALKTAGELGIEMGIFNCPGWSQSGGPWIKPEEAMRNWTPNGIEICKTKQGTDVACGPCSDEAEGLEVDKLSKKHVQNHFESFFGEILRRIPQKDRPTLTTVVVDSWERGKQNYTDSIFVKFKQRFGYELDYSQVIDPKDSSFKSQVSRDLNLLISDLVASEYMGGLTEKAHEYGLRTWCEPYAHSPFPGNSITYGSAADEVAAEFWVNDRKFRKKEVDAAIGAARRSGKNRVWAESFTDGAWDKVAQDDWSFEKLKPIADRYFHAGINASILHVVISQPGDDREPAVRPWFGTFFDRRSTHSADVKPLVEYLRRCNFMLQLGRPLDGATDQRIMDDGTTIRFTDDSQFEVTFPDNGKEVWNPLTLSRESLYSHYLFTYFTGNSTEEQQVSYAVSDNGLDFTPLNVGKPVIASDTISMSGGVRDPHILRGDDGWFRMVLTDMDWQRGKWSNRGIVMLRSRDLINWEHRAIHFPARYAGHNAAKADAVWAPQTIYDPEAGKYMVYFSLHSPKDGPFPQDVVYYAYANDDFTDLEGDEPQRLFTFDGPTIDTDIVRDRKGMYHVFFNTWGNGGTGRRQFLAQSLHQPERWTLVDGLMQPEGMKMKSEGSSAYPLQDGKTWVLAYDCFADGVFHFCTSTDLLHFKLERERRRVGELGSGMTKTGGLFTPRHGSVISITSEEYQQLLNAIPNE